jgi:hypothetical protein
MERSALLAPKLVTVHAENAAVSRVFDDLTQQTGYRLTCQPGQIPAVTLHLENVPFWTAVDAVCQQSGLSLQPYFDHTNALTFSKVGRAASHLSYSGAFRLSAASFHLARTLDLNAPQPLNPFKNQRNETLTFMFHVVGEPKVRLLSLGQPRVSVAIDEHNNSLIAPQSRHYDTGYHNYFYGYRTPMQQTQLQILGPGNATTLKLIKGSLAVTMLAEAKPEIVINDIMNVKSKLFEGTQVSLEIDEVKEGPGKQIRVRATARRNAKDNEHDYSWTNSLGQRIELFDEAGNKFNSDGFNWDSGGPTSVTGNFMFGTGNNAKLGKPAKLVYYNWISTQHQVEFEFHDLPLP